MNCIVCGKAISGRAAFCDLCGSDQGLERVKRLPPPYPVPSSSQSPRTAGRVSLRYVALAIAGVPIIQELVAVIGAYA